MGRGEGVGPLGAADMARGVGSGLGDVSGLGGPRVIYILRNTNSVTQMKEPQSSLAGSMKKIP